MEKSQKNDEGTMKVNEGKALRCSYAFTMSVVFIILF